MDQARAATLRFVASQLVFVAALVHLGLGVIEWARYGSYGILVPPDYRWPAFVLSGLAILGGLWFARRAENMEPYYLLGILAMLTYVVGYFAWHLGGHRPLLVAGPSTHHHLTVGFVVDHYFAGVLETLSLTVELAAVVLLAVLYVADR